MVTPRTLAEFKGDTLILPDVRILSDSERSWLQQYVGAGKKADHYRRGCNPTPPGSQRRPN